MYQNLTNLFKKLDKNNDGKLNTTAFKKLIKMVNHDPNLVPTDKQKKEYTFDDFIQHVTNNTTIPTSVNFSEITNMLNQYPDEDVTTLVKQCINGHKINLNKLHKAVENFDFTK